MDTTQGTVAVLGDSACIEGYGLVGATLLVADTAGEVRRRWAALPTGTRLVLLTANAATSLEIELQGQHDVLIAVMPP